MIRSIGTIYYSLLCLNSWIGFNELKYLYSVISVIDKRLPGNTKKWTLVRSWTARVRLVHPWAACLLYKINHMSNVKFVTSHMNGVCLIWMSHFARGWVMSHMNESCLMRMSHVAYAWVMLRMNESCRMWTSHIAYKQLMLHTNESFRIWMSHVAYEWVMSHMNESYHIWMSHVTYEWVMLHTNESCCTQMSHVAHQCVMSHMDRTSHVKFVRRCDKIYTCMYTCIYMLHELINLYPRTHRYEQVMSNLREDATKSTQLCIYICMCFTNT